MKHRIQKVVGRRTFSDVLDAHPFAFPQMGGEQNLAVVAARIARRRFYYQEAELAGVSTTL